MVCTAQLHLNQPTSKIIVNHDSACATMATCDKIWKDVGSNPGSYTEYGKNCCDINHRSYCIKKKFMANGIMLNVTIHSLISKCCQLMTTFPSCKVSLHCVYTTPRLK